MDVLVKVAIVVATTLVLVTAHVMFSNFVVMVIVMIIITIVGVIGMLVIAVDLLTTTKLV
jgi:hypothetical protein